jgi:hypothetical protein
VNRRFFMPHLRIAPIAGLLLLAWTAGALPAHGQLSEAIAIREDFNPGYQYHVTCRVNIKGELVVPAEKEKDPSVHVPVVGLSKINYDERILTIKDGKVDRSVRYYQEMKFERQAAKNEQRGSLRDAVRRLVILRHKQFEVPFSPDGPLLWDEIDMVRTDVFTPALRGLLPPGKVRPSDSWYADPSAVQELTDLENITDGRLKCVFATVDQFGERAFAHIDIKGRIKGVGEDGPAEHELDGHLLFDLTSKHLSYLTMKGTQYLLDRYGKPTGGRIQGDFVLTRDAAPATAQLSDSSLKGLNLEPNEENTRLWFISPEVGLSFLYARQWHVAGVNSEKRQVGLDEKRGSGILISVDANVPPVATFQKEVASSLNKQNMKVLKTEKPRTVVAGVDTFQVEAESAGKRIYLQYFLIRQPTGGAVLTANLQQSDLTALQQDVERIARSIVITSRAK